MKISNNVKTLALGTASVLGLGLRSASSVFAESTAFCPDGTAAKSLSDCKDKGVKNANNQDNLMDTLNLIISIVIGVIGFVAVVMIIFGGVQYTTSAGEPGKVKKAKDTIMYGIIGLVVAILAFAIVNFVLAGITKK